MYLPSSPPLTPPPPRSLAELLKIYEGELPDALLPPFPSSPQKTLDHNNSNNQVDSAGNDSNINTMRKAIPWSFSPQTKRKVAGGLSNEKSGRSSTGRNRNVSSIKNNISIQSYLSKAASKVVARPAP